MSEPFTDAQLSILKKSEAFADIIWVQSFVSRLEAAEDCIHGHHSNCTSQMNNERCSCGVYKWRKAAGK